MRRLREQIAERDRAVLDAVNARLRLVAELRHHKQSEGIDFVDSEQEERGWGARRAKSNREGKLAMAEYCIEHARNH